MIIFNKKDIKYFKFNNEKKNIYIINIFINITYQDIKKYS